MSYLQYRDYYNDFPLIEQINYNTNLTPNLADPVFPHVKPVAVYNLSYNERNPNCDKYAYTYYNQVPYQDPTVALNMIVIKLTSNIPEARYIDPNLIIPWGIIVINDIIWVCDSDNGLITNYDLLGRPLPVSINVFNIFRNIGHPTGIAFNSNLDIFPIHNGSTTKSCTFLIATRNGTINGYNFMLDPGNSFIVINKFNENAVYTGIAVVEQLIYATDFYNKRIDVFNGIFEQIQMTFIDEYSGDPIPDTFSPYNIVCIDNVLFVSYALQNPIDNQFELSGTGNGFISIFNLNGRFIKRFVSRGVLDTPWAIIEAPTYFGYPEGSIIIGNHGNGNINVFTKDGYNLGTLNDGSNNTIYIEGLRGLAINPIYNRVLYWTSSYFSVFENSSMGTITYRRLN